MQSLAFCYYIQSPQNAPPCTPSCSPPTILYSLAQPILHTIPPLPPPHYTLPSHPLTTLPPSHHPSPPHYTLPSHPLTTLPPSHHPSPPHYTLPSHPLTTLPPSHHPSPPHYTLPSHPLTTLPPSHHPSLPLFAFCKQKVERVVFVGNYLRNNQMSMQMLAYSMEYWSGGSIRALFMEHEGYFGALGTLLMHFGMDSRQ